ncbi:hypothetical protein VM1G_00019 [Cytospora mali]|uniref:Uncharacterized protein n=1 Tax=Cytospora mali TaxID=578113 RepID=A0A194VMN4_CYTMA|nr:hypothetical protein VM1G_00019 [Valsa mali]
MVRYTLALVAALAAQDCVAAPMVIPTPLLPSLSLSGVPLPTGGLIGVAGSPRGGKREEDLPRPASIPFTLPSLSLSLPSVPPLPTGTPAEKRQDFASLPGFPSSLLKSSSLSASQLPKRGDEVLPTLPFTLPTGLPTGLAIPGNEKRQDFLTVSGLPSFSLSLSIPTPTGSLLPKREEEELPTPTLPFSLPTGLPTGIAIHGEQKRQDFFTLSNLPSLTNSIPIPTGSLLPKRDGEDLPTPTLPFSLPAGLPTGLVARFRG